MFGPRVNFVILFLENKRDHFAVPFDHDYRESLALLKAYQGKKIPQRRQDSGTLSLGN